MQKQRREAKYLLTSKQGLKPFCQGGGRFATLPDLPVKAIRQITNFAHTFKQALHTCCMHSPGAL